MLILPMTCQKVPVHREEDTHLTPGSPRKGLWLEGRGARPRETWGARCQGQLQDVVAESPEQGPDGHPDGEASG